MAGQARHPWATTDPKGPQLDMYESKPIVAVVCASMTVLCVLVFSTTAMALTHSWMVGGTTLSGSAALSTSAHVDEGLRVEVPAASITVECADTSVTATSPEIIAPNMGAAQSVELSECKTVASKCVLSSPKVKFLPVTAEATLDGTLAIKEIIKPKTKTTFTTVKLEGETCGFAGTQAVTGQSTFLAPTGQDERTLQLFSSKPTKGELKAGGDEAILKVASLVGLVSGSSWSFL